MPEDVARLRVGLPQRDAHSLDAVEPIPDWKDQPLGKTSAVTYEVLNRDLHELHGDKTEGSGLEALDHDEDVPGGPDGQSVGGPP